MANVRKERCKRSIRKLSSKAAMGRAWRLLWPHPVGCCVRPNGGREPILLKNSVFGEIGEIFARMAQLAF